MKKIDKKFFDYEENQKGLIIALFVALILVGIELIQFLIKSFLQFINSPSFNTETIILLSPIPLLLWLIAVNGRGLPGFKENNVVNKLKNYSKIIFIIILIEFLIIIFIKIIEYLSFKLFSS